MQGNAAAELSLRQSSIGSYRVTVSSEGAMDLYRGPVLLQSAIVSLTPGDWFSLRVQALGPSLIVWLNDVEIMQVQDDMRLPPGTVAVGGSFADDVGELQVDDLKLWLPQTPTVETATWTPTLSSTPTETAAPETPGLTLVFQDSFDEGDLSGWLVGEGWSLVASEDGQALSTASDSEAVEWIGDPLWNTAVQGQFLLEGGTARLSVRYSAVGSYSAEMDAIGQVTLYRGDAQIASGLANFGEAGQWHTLYLSTLDNELRVKVDDSEVIYVQDSAPLPPGTVAFSHGGEGTLLVDNVMIWSQGEGLLVSATAQPSPGATSTVESDIELTDFGKPVSQHLSSDLSSLYSSWGTSAFDTTVQSLVEGLEMRGGQIRVMLVMLDSASAEAAKPAIEALGGEVANQFKSWIDAWVPIQNLEQVAAIDGVSLVRTPIRLGPVPGDLPSTPPQDVGPEDMIPASQLVVTTTSNVPGRIGAQSSVYATSTVSATIDTITRNRCVITTAFTVGAAGKYDFEIWDDGAQLYHKLYSAKTGQRINANYTFNGASNSSANGYGVAVATQAGDILASEDPYTLPVDVHQFCSNGVISREVSVSGAQTWHDLGWIGSNVKVAVMDSFLGYTLAQQNGELPVNINVEGTLDLSSPHGTSVAEILFDMAPGADFTFASPNNAVEAASLIVTLAQQGNRVISSSLGYFNGEPGDGTGMLADAIATARSYGTLYVQAAGNQATYNWQGQFRDNNLNGFHDFASGDRNQSTE